MLDLFGNIAQNLSRNPLSIIALFIVLVYGIAGLVLSVSAEDLEVIERLPLIAFLTIFPVIVLGAFYGLVANHHWKLYAPQDFKDERTFYEMARQSPAEMTLSLQEEAMEAVQAEQLDRAESGEDRVEAQAVADKVMADEAEFRERYSLAEDLALRELEAQLGTEPIKHVKSTTVGRIDALFIRGYTYIVEVKLLRHRIRPEIVRNVLKNFEALHASGEIGPQPHYILAIVADSFGKEHLQEETERALAELRTSDLHHKIVQLEVFDFDALREKYGLQKYARFSD